MGRCKQDMIDAGERIVPRTCPVHGLKPCREKNVSREEGAALKNIAGLIQKLSYRDMNLLGVKLSAALETKDGYSALPCAEALLEVADKILEKDAA